MAEFVLKVLSPTKKIFEGRVSYCAIATVQGELGIEARHEPFMAIIKENSRLRYRSASGEGTIEVAHGMLSFDRANECLVILEERNEEKRG